MDRQLGIDRRGFLKAAAGGALAAGGVLPAACARAAKTGGHKRVLVLGIDGMDPDLLRRYVAEGRMPHFEQLMRRGDFRPLRSSIPPQSPVAWSNFITGMNPGGHGIYDFIHRDPATYRPYLSTSQSIPAKTKVPIGGWRIPLQSGRVRLLRRGPAFWEILSDHGVPCTLFRLPANFPPLECGANTISGLGTPDLMGTQGVSFYITDLPPPNREAIRDTEVIVVDMSKHNCEAHLVGPANPFRKATPPARVKLTIHRDPANPVARITVHKTQILLKQGEWSDWVRLRFDLLPHMKSVTGICRFFLKAVHPRFKLYVTPVNIDPSKPALPISTPPGFARRLARDLGPYYTQGIAEDTKALSSGILEESEYLEQAMYAFGERLEAYDHFLRRFRNGLFFFYFATIDLNSHMYWRATDPRHPLYTPELGRQYGKTIEDLYGQMDVVLGQTFNHIDDDTTLIILSDHGFSPFYRTFNVNSWLLENGYAKLRDYARRGTQKLFANTDWSKTAAYGLGINSVYLNMQGREKEGIVRAGSAAKDLINEIARKLENEKDPETGQPIVARAYKKDEVYRGKWVNEAPDIVLGYHRGYRASWKTILGTYEWDVVGDNDDKWSGDHCMDVNDLDGVLLANRTITSETPALLDLAPTILAQYGIEPPPGTEGKAVIR